MYSQPHALFSSFPVICESSTTVDLVDCANVPTAFPLVFLFSLRGRIKGYLIRVDSSLTLRKDYCTLVLLFVTEKDTKWHSFPTVSLLTVQIVSYYALHAYKVWEITTINHRVYIINKIKIKLPPCITRGCSFYRNSG